MTRNDSRSRPPHAEPCETKPERRQAEESRSVDIERPKDVPHCFGQRDLRCPMLRPDPAQAQRLAEIIANLHERIGEATERGWLGEVEGLQVSLEGARQKYQQMRKLRGQTTAVYLGPTRSSTTPA